MQKELMDKISGHQILWDGRTVWVNSGATGVALGRFGRFGVDVHREAAEQDKGACLACFAGGGGDGWNSFCALMLEHYGVSIPEQAAPDFLVEGESGHGA